jgi:hypothetical protein
MNVTRLWEELLREEAVHAAEEAAWWSRQWLSSLYFADEEDHAFSDHSGG